MAGYFDTPFVSRIERDNELRQGKPKVVVQGTVAQPTIDVDQQILPIDEIPDEPGTTVAGTKGIVVEHPFKRAVVKSLEKLKAKLQHLSNEIDAFQKLGAQVLNPSLVGAPPTVIEAVNSLVGGETIIYTSKPDEELAPNESNVLPQCHVDCVMEISNKGPNPTDDDVSDLDKALTDAANLSDGVMDAINRQDVELSGWTMFIFMVKFILAYAVHMLLGFLCCFFKDKLIVDVGVDTFYFGAEISVIIGDVERFLKRELGFPCRDKKHACVDTFSEPNANVFSVFPCCTSQNASDIEIDEDTLDDVFGAETSCRGTRLDSGAPSPAQIEECYKAAVSQFMGDVMKIDMSKPCQCGKRPRKNKYGQGVRGRANTVANWLIGNSTSGDLNGTNPNNQISYPTHALTNMAHLRNTTDTGIQATDKMLGALDQSQAFSFIKDNPDCDSLALGDIADLLNKEDPTLQDLQDALLGVVDTDFTEFLGDPTGPLENINGCTPIPDLEPFRTLCEVTQGMDATLGEVADEIRKYLSALRSGVGVLTSRDYCCIIFTLVFLGNLIQYARLCPNKTKASDIEKMFAFASALKNGKDIDKVICEIQFIKELLEALNAEMLEEISVIGISLPLGTMVEILKKVVANTVAALLAIALAPINQLLTQLENAPALKDLLNLNCFGIGDLLAMIKCGIDWLLDLIKEWLEDLFTYKTNNVNILGDLRIQSMKFGFLSQLIDLLDLLLDILLSIGDCYTPEDITDQIMNGLDEKAKVKASEVARALGNLDEDDAQTFIGISQPVVQEDGTVLFEDIQDEVVGTLDQSPIVPQPGQSFKTDRTFPIFPAEMVRYKQAIRRSLESLGDIIVEDDQGDITFSPEVVEEMVGGGLTRERTREQLLNLVRTLTSAA